MFLTNDVVAVLTGKLGFDQQDLFKIEASLDTAAKCLGYLCLVRSKSVGKPEKLKALENLQSLKEGLQERRGRSNLDLERAHALHYSFRSRNPERRVNV